MLTLYVKIRFSIKLLITHSIHTRSKQYFPDIRGGVHGFGVPPVNVRNVQQNAEPNRFFGGGAAGWGQGQRLGDN